MQTGFVLKLYTEWIETSGDKGFIKFWISQALQNVTAHSCLICFI